MLQRLALSLFALLFIVLAAATCGGPKWEGPVTERFDGKRFHNLDEDYRPRSGWEAVRWIVTRDTPEWPAWIEPEHVPRLDAPLEEGEVAVTFVNHASFLVQFRGLTLLTDPIWSERSSPVGFAGPFRVRPPGVALADLPPIDDVVISHDHYDHLDLATLRAIEAEHDPVILVGLGLGAWLRERGLENVVELDWWQDHASPGGPSAWRAVFTPARHHSGRKLGSLRATLWGSWVIEADGFRLFFAGDTGYGVHFTRIREDLGEIDLALLPIGAYEPRDFMIDHHMNPADAVRAHLDLGSPPSVPMHYQTFAGTSDEEFDAPLLDLAAAREAVGVPPTAFAPLGFGETRVYRARGR